MSAKNTYVLIPGSWHGAWCWYKIIPRLKAEGHNVMALDLPGHGKDKTDCSAITLDSYINAVGEILNQQKEKVILVGHSRGGIVISQVAEQFPDKIKKLVYVCAFLVPDGVPMVALAKSDTNSLLVQNLEFNEAENWHMVNRKAIREIFYHDCADEDVALAETLLTPEPLAPVVTPLQLTNVNFGRVPKVYIETLQDKALSNSVQKTMYSSANCEKIFSMNTSHSPFLSQPDELAKHLIAL